MKATVVMAQTPVNAAFETAAGLFGAAVTISLRTVRFQNGLMTGKAHLDPENTRMVTEKIAAAGEGFAAGARAWMRFANANPLAPWLVAAHFSEALYAPARPGLRRAQANARRLSRIHRG